MAETGRALVVASAGADALRVAKALAVGGMPVAVLDLSGSAHLRWSRFCRRHIPIDDGPAICGEPDRLSELIEREGSRWNANVVVPAGMRATLAMATLPCRFGSAARFPVSDREVLAMLRDKSSFRRVASRFGIPEPATIQLHGPEAALDWPGSFPCVVKTTAKGGGEGVEVVRSPDELRHTVRDLSLRYGWPLLVQQYVPGNDLVSAFLCDRGRIVCSSHQEYATDGTHVTFTEEPPIVEMLGPLLEELRVDGVVQFDFRRRAGDGALLAIECNPRFWASVGLSLLAGLNFPVIGARLAMGAPRSEIESLADRYRPGRITWPSTLVRNVLRLRRPPAPVGPRDLRALWYSCSDPGARRCRLADIE